ncbi:MAG: TonB-dependent receptor [Bryobacteraceae bacterium]
MKRSSRGPARFFCMSLCLPVIAAAQSASLADASLEALMDIRVTSVSKKDQPLAKAASAVFVITQNDIRHSGATNIPDLLRMVPGVNVARITANTWAISIRGFNSRYSGKVLVLIDGRTVYTPLFSGVYWDQQGMPLEDIDRIEVIRGSGGTVWGANAMNGVINVITKSAADTHGALVRASTGSQGHAGALVQYGAAAGTKGSYRIYSRYAMNGDSPPYAGKGVDSGHSSQAGFRSDWTLSPQDRLTVQADVLGASEAQSITTLFSNRLPDSFTFNDKVRFAAGNVLANWNHVFDNGSETTLHVYYDRYRRFDQGLNTTNTGDVDLQYHFRAFSWNDIVTGLSYRLTDQSWSDGYSTVLGTGHRRDNLFTTFVQDEVQIAKTVALTIGVKVEHNAYTGFEFEPSVKLAYSPNSRQTIWAAASRSIQQTSWLYSEALVDYATVPVQGGFAVYRISGNPDGIAPVLFAYELGYRTELSHKFTLDTTVFIYDYDRLQTLEPEARFIALTPAPPHVVLPHIFESFGAARNYGFEASAGWDAARWWRLSPGFSYLQNHLSLDPRSKDSSYLLTHGPTRGDAPKRQVQLRSNIRLPHNLEWDVSAFYVGSLQFGPVPAYTRLDTRLGWRIGETLELSIAGQNLLSPRHIEFLDSVYVNPTEVQRGVVAKLTWRR